MTFSSSTARTCWQPTWISWFQRSNRRSSMMTSRWGIKRAQLLGRVEKNTKKDAKREWSKIYTISIPMICNDMYIYIHMCVCEWLCYLQKWSNGSIKSQWFSFSRDPRVCLSQLPSHCVCHGAMFRSSVPEKMHTVRVAESCLIHFGRAVNIDCWNDDV